MSFYSSTVLADSPLAYYRLDEAVGSTANDASGHGYAGTLSSSGVTLRQAGALSVDTDAAMLFDGTAGQIVLPSTLSSAGWNALSIEAWINLSNLTFGYTANVMANDAPNTTHIGFQLGVSATSVIFRIGTGSAANQLTVNKSFAASTWYRICAVFNGTSMTIYIRDLAGNLTTGTTTFTACTIASTTNPIYIASRPVTINNFPGLLDEVALYNYALSSTQDATHYSAGTIATAPYTYGSFQIASHSAGLGYYLQSKDIDLPIYQPIISPIARYDGWKINGWQVKERQIQCDITVIGSSRIDCMSRLDALYQALTPRDQQLVIHEDGRYWTANATAGKARFQAGKGIVQATVPVTFLCAHPYARAISAAAPYDTGNLAYAQSGSSYVSTIFNISGGGTVYAWPQIHLVNQTPSLGSTILTSALVQGQSYNAIFVSNTSFSGSVGQILTLYYNTGTQLWTQKVVVSSAFATSTVQIAVNPFTAAFNFPSAAPVYVSTAWNQLSVAQLTDNYTLSVTSTAATPLPQTLGDYIDIYTDPSSGMYIATNGLSQYSDFVGAFPPLEPGNTQWQVSVAADSAPTVEAVWVWTARYAS